MVDNEDLDLMYLNVDSAIHYSKEIGQAIAR